MLVAPGPLVTMATPGSAGDLGVPLGHVARTLLVAHQDVPDGRVEDRVVDRQDGAAGEAEHHLHLLHLQALDQCLCSGQFHRVLPCRLVVLRWSCVRCRSWVRCAVSGPGDRWRDMKTTSRLGGRKAHTARRRRVRYETSTRMVRSDGDDSHSPPFLTRSRRRRKYLGPGGPGVRRPPALWHHGRWRVARQACCARPVDACLALPEVTERPSHGTPAFFVRDRKAFVYAWLDGHHGNHFPHLWCAAEPGVQEILVQASPTPSSGPPTWVPAAGSGSASTAGSVGTR